MESEERNIIATQFPSSRAGWRKWWSFARHRAGLHGLLGRRRGSMQNAGVVTRPPSEHAPEVGTTLIAPPGGDLMPTPPNLPNRAGGVRVPSCHSFRVLFVVRHGSWDAACMRYRAFQRHGSASVRRD